MTDGSGTVVRLDELRRRRRDSRARLREAEYWRRLVSARLDLAVAAVTGPSPGDCPALPDDLLRLLAPPGPDTALAEAAALLPLRDALDRLDGLVATLRDAAGPGGGPVADRRAACAARPGDRTSGVSHGGSVVRMVGHVTPSPDGAARHDPPSD